VLFGRCAAQRDDIERAKHALTVNHFDEPTADNSAPMLFVTGERGRSDFGHRKGSTLVLPPAPPWFERIGLTAFFTARRQAQTIFAASGTRPRLLSLSHFSLLRQDFAYAIKLMMQEKEILLFATLEWLVVGLAYPCGSRHSPGFPTACGPKPRARTMGETRSAV
jgi:hypothetical protein